VGTALLLLAIIFLLIFCGIPVSFSLGAVATAGIFMLHGNPMQIIPQAVFGGMNYFPLLAIPFFILAGELMNEGGITIKLVRFADLLVGRLPAGLAHTNILACMFFGGVTGSAPADTSAIGGLLIPAMKKEGYPIEFSAALTASASTMGPIIPPSIIMVIFGSTVGVSIGALFAGGVIPGILIAIGLMITVMIMNSLYKYPRRSVAIQRKEIGTILKDAFWPLGMPVIILGGILAGVFTPTEAGAVAVLYALIVGFFVLKTLKVSQLLPMLRHTAVLTSTILLIIGTAKILGWVFTVLQVQVLLGQLFLEISSSPLVFLLLVNILLLIMGTFMDAGASVILLAPILTPIAISLGINPIHFGLIMIINLTIGHCTPPLGLCLFVACGIANITLEKISRAIVPFIITEVIVLFFITYIPELGLFIPRLMGYLN
jgi:tripartite ATP-independent transporter DctM subunit